MKKSEQKIAFTNFNNSPGKGQNTAIFENIKRL